MVITPFETPDNTGNVMPEYTGVNEPHFGAQDTEMPHDTYSGPTSEGVDKATENVPASLAVTDIGSAAVEATTPQIPEEFRALVAQLRTRTRGETARRFMDDEAERMSNRDMGKYLDTLQARAAAHRGRY